MKEISIYQLQKSAHQNALDKGFYEGIEDFYELDFQQQQLHVSQKIMLIVSEASEAFEVLRKMKNDEGIYMPEKEYDIAAGGEEFNSDKFKIHIKDTLPDELADVVIRVLDLAGWLDINLQRHIELKMKYNSTREAKHGKNF